ncbi:MAG TPA: hypothetical protein VK152_07100 [Paludibacter sp.]|nr:hypothetical protein [Paludibacter sp.]
MNEKTREFIYRHANEDVFDLKLKYGRVDELDIELAVRQISGRQKMKNKVPLFFETEGILYPAQLSVEQSSSQATALYKKSLCEGKSLVDLTGGFGIDCYFMSERFEKTTYVERNPGLCELALHNFSVLDKAHIHVACSNAESYLSGMDNADWIYMDPARRNPNGKKLVLLSDCEPDVPSLYNLLHQKASHVMMKLSPMLDIASALRELPLTTAVHIISVENECKEILLVSNAENSLSLEVNAINLTKNGMQKFGFTPSEEAGATVACTAEIKKYLYEPNASILKSGAFKITAHRFGLDKLHINTHLYTSSELVPDFPGRVFEVLGIWDSVKDKPERVKQANLSTRNYPLSTNELRNKLRLKDGGNIYLFACTLANEKKVIIECGKLS